MTDRIRPEDLRAIMAAIAGQGTPASDLPKEMGWAQAAIMMADELLAELARTAKPEMAAPRLHACHDCQQAEAEADARAEAAEARLVESGEHIVASDATIARLNAELARAMERIGEVEDREADWLTTAHAVIDGGGTPSQVAALVVELRQQLAQGCQQGTQSERNRLCRLFTRHPYQIRIHCPCSTETTSLTYETARLTYETALRHAEPPPVQR